MKALRTVLSVFLNLIVFMVILVVGCYGLIILAAIPIIADSF